jgi:hypothetical protein
VELHRNSPFAEYSNKGFLMSIGAMITFATINAIVAYYYYAPDSKRVIMRRNEGEGEKEKDE